MRINSRTSLGTDGQPGLPRRIFQLQNRPNPWRCQPNGGRLEDGKARFPAVPDRGEPGPEEAVSGGELRTLDGALEYANLMAQGEDLQLQGGSAPKRGAQEGEKSRRNRSKTKATDE